MRHNKQTLILTLLLALLWSGASQAADAALSSQQVRQWLEHRIELAHIQNRMKQNPAQYQDLPRAYAQKKQRYLQAHGYSAERFSAHQTRIFNAMDAIARAQENAAGQGSGSGPSADCEQRIAKDIRDASAAPDELEQQLAQMRELGLPEAQIDAIRQAQTALRDSAEQTAQQTCAAQAQAAASAAAHDQQLIDSSQRDWAGVRPWLQQLEHFSNWYAGNDTHPAPPELD